MITSIGQIIALCIKMTNLKLDVSCGFDRQFAQKWYENEYLTGKHTRYVMKPNLTINSFEDGKVYRAFNCDDAKAVEFMEKDPAYRDYFVDLQAEPVPIPELEEEDGGGGIKADTEPEADTEPTPEPEADTEPTPEPEEKPTELSDEEAAALKRSEAAKKAAATRAAKKAAEEAAALEAAKLAEFEGE